MDLEITTLQAGDIFGHQCIKKSENDESISEFNYIVCSNTNNTGKIWIYYTDFDSVEHSFPNFFSELAAHGQI